MPKRAPKTKKLRLDELLVSRGLAESRSRAQAMILAGEVRSESAILDKPGRTVAEDIDLIIKDAPRYVGRGAEKLEGFLETFSIDVSGLNALDVGASTGGFTDCLLQRGASHVVCVDVGHGQLHYKLRTDPRVTNLERVNARNLNSDQLPRSDYDIVVMDLSFISLTKVWPAVWPLVRSNGLMVSLIKPQFEAGKPEVDAGKGVIRDPEIQQRVVREIREFACQSLPGSTETGLCESPIKGSDGNVEFLLGLKRVDSPPV